jgi:hypothetical protein
VLSSLTTKNYGFSDAADIFVFDLGSDFRWRYRFVAYDDRSILLDLVQRKEKGRMVPLHARLGGIA